jgi:hypothetical protein
MGNVLEKAKQEQVIALGRLGWSLRRIEAATGVRRETAGGYLRSAGVALRTPGGWGRNSELGGDYETRFKFDDQQPKSAQLSESRINSRRRGNNGNWPACARQDGLRAADGL